jgi:hypothetical protein
MLLGNETLTLQARANLALCYGRLGRYEDQLKCATDAAGIHQDRPMDYTDVQLASSAAMPHAMAGRIDKMRASLDESERRLRAGADPYICQAWGLWKADILAAAGLVEEASRAAVHAILHYDMTLLCSAVAGVFARWLAMTCDDGPRCQRAASILADLVTNLDDYDALDQIEILCASLMHGCNEVDKHLEQLQTRTSQVPETALASLKVCGIPVGF